jgi:hypothetical protein
MDLLRKPIVSGDQETGKRKQPCGIAAMWQRCGSEDFAPRARWLESVTVMPGTKPGMTNSWRRG